MTADARVKVWLEGEAIDVLDAERKRVRQVTVPDIPGVVGLGLNTSYAKQDYVKNLTAAVLAAENGPVVFQDGRSTLVVLTPFNGGCSGVRINFDSDGKAWHAGTWWNENTPEDELEYSLRVNSGAGIVLVEPESSGVR